MIRIAKAATSVAAGFAAGGVAEVDIGENEIPRVRTEELIAFFHDMRYAQNRQRKIENFRRFDHGIRWLDGQTVLPVQPGVPCRVETTSVDQQQCFVPAERSPFLFVAPLLRWLMYTTRLHIVCTGAALLLAGAATCAQDHAQGEQAVTVPAYYRNPVQKEVTDYEYFTGRTEAATTVEIRPRVTGYLMEINFKPGAEVKKGERLLKIDPGPYKAELDRAEAQMELAQARLKLAMSNTARSQSLAKTGAVSREEIDRDAAAQREAETAVKTAEVNLKAAKLNLEYTDIFAPIDGVIGRNLVTVGNLVTQDQTLLATITSQEPMFVYFEMDERTLLRLQKIRQEGKPGTVQRSDHLPVEFSLADEEGKFPHKGEVDFINNRVDPATGTVQVRGVFKNPPVGAGQQRLLVPGLLVRVRLAFGSPHPALLVPHEALGTAQAQKFLYVINAKNRVEICPVEMGALQAGDLSIVKPRKVVREESGLRLATTEEIQAGKGEDSLTASDKVIVRGLQRFRPGMLVDPKPEGIEKDGK
jgi:membrane fusion protein, multidrug efflux system